MLVSLTGVFLMIALVGVAVIPLTQTSRQSALSAGTGGSAHYLAESGLRYAQYLYCSEGWEEGEERIMNPGDGGQVHLTRDGEIFVAAATVHAGTAMEARARVTGPVLECGGEDDEGSSEPKAADFLQMGPATTVGQGNVVHGAVAAVDGEANIEGTVYGDVVGDEISLEGGGTVVGDLVSAGLIHVKQGFVEGNIYTAGEFLVEGSSSVTGSIYARGTITIKGHASTVSGDVHSCEGSVIIQGSGRVEGNVFASGDVILEGSGRVDGNVDAGGIIQISSTSTPIGGNATAALEIVGPSWFGEEQWDSVVGGIRCEFCTPAAPICPPPFQYDALALPPATDFTAGGARVGKNSWRGSEQIPPGSYGKVDLRGSESRLYVQAGDYFFQAMRFGYNGGIYVDLSSGGDVHLFVEGDVALGGQFDIYVSLDGSNYVVANDASVPPELAARIYLESHGDFSMGSPGRWFGAVYTPFGSLGVGWGSDLTGGFYSGGGHSIGGSTLYLVAPNYFLQ